MKTFVIYNNQKKSCNMEKLIFVEEGFSYNAFFLNILYALYNKLWLFFLVLFLTLVGLEFLHYRDIVETSTYYILRLIIAIYSAVSYTDWYQEKLVSQGYFIQDIILANNTVEAKLKFCNYIEANSNEENTKLISKTVI